MFLDKIKLLWNSLIFSGLPLKLLYKGPKHPLVSERFSHGVGGVLPNTWRPAHTDFLFRLVLTPALPDSVWFPKKSFFLLLLLGGSGPPQVALCARADGCSTEPGSEAPLPILFSHFKMMLLKKKKKSKQYLYIPKDQAEWIEKNLSHSPFLGPLLYSSETATHFYVFSYFPTHVCVIYLSRYFFLFQF